MAEKANIIRLDWAGSTNDEAKCLALAGAQEGTVVTANCQTAGRGRCGRSWQSAPGLGLYMSLILKPKGGLGQAALLPVMTACAASIAIEELTVTPAFIKWPNDIVMEYVSEDVSVIRKVCGILVETSCDGEGNCFAVAGMGVNVGHSEFPPDIADKAASLYMASGRLIALDDVMYAIRSKLLDIYNNWDAGEAVNAYRGRCINIGRRVSFCKSGETIVGVAKDVEETGALIVDGQDGRHHTLYAGDVSVRGVMGGYI